MLPRVLALLIGCAGAAVACAQGAAPEPATSVCGERVVLAPRDRVTLAYALTMPATPPAAALLLLPGGHGRVDLDAQGCARALRGNSLVRAVPRFVAAGIATALVDAPSDYGGPEGLMGFRGERGHAEDLGRVIADLRARTGAREVWVAGTSRGSISAANLATAALAGPMAPDGVVLTSIVVVGGRASPGRGWLAQTALDPPLARATMPLLALAHREDRCFRSPPWGAARVVEAAGSTRKQAVTLEGVPGAVESPGNACEGMSAHGFIGVEAEMVAGIVRFIGGGRF